MIRFIRDLFFVFFGCTLSYVFGNHYKFFGIDDNTAMWLSTLSLILFVIGVFGLLSNYCWRGY